MIPENIENYSSALSASDVTDGSYAEDRSYWEAWYPLHDSMQATSLTNNVHTYFCNFVGWSTDVMPSEMWDEVVKQCRSKFLNGRIIDTEGVFKLVNSTPADWESNSKIAQLQADKYYKLADEAKTKKKRQEYEAIAGKYDSYKALFDTAYNTYHDYYDKYQTYKEEWRNDLETAKNALSAPEDSSGNTTDGSGEDKSTVDTSTDPSVATPDTSADVDKKAEAVTETLKNMYEAWDPRLKRADYFLMKNENDEDGIRVPFSSYTAATAFGDQTWKLEAGIALSAFNSKNLGGKPLVAENVGFLKLFGSQLSSVTGATNGSTGSESTNNAIETSNSLNPFKGMKVDEKVVMQNTEELYKEDKFWGAQSIVNPFSLTRLTGGFAQEGQINYMYDIRDRRRFYGMSITDTDNVLAVSNPTVTLIIEWGNADSWGRTPYSFQDFVYCKYFGQIPNNRLITFRRYSAPCVDNLQFENMFGKHEQTTKDASGNVKITQVYPSKEENEDKKVFSPHASVVTWFGGDTGNTLSALLNFSTGMKWGQVESKQHEVSGNEGESKQAVVDRLLGDGDHKGLFGGAEHGGVNSLLETGSWLTAKVTSFGKFDLAMNGTIGMDQAAFDKLSGANVDPYEQTLENRIKGPVNRIDAVKKREAGIEFSQTLSIKCSYSAKAIGGINPKAALLDCLGNCLEMASPHAVFWGGSYRFNIKPTLYPFHDGGWRDSFMSKIYDGKFLGKDGAVALVLSGIKSVGCDADGNFSMDSIKSALGGAAGGLLSMVGSAIQSVADMFGGSDLLGNIADGLSGKGAELQGLDASTAKAEAQSKLNNMFGNLEQLWHNKMAAETMQPQIQGMGALLIGAPVGEWHLTIGNPFNPIAVIGNLICTKMDVAWDDELGPDDFPTGFTVTYSIEHGMARDSDAIQSMFNRGMGKFYTLPDYMSTSSDGMTHVDKYTADNGHGDTGTLKYKNSGSIMKEAKAAAGGGGTFQTLKVSGGTRGALAGNFNTLLITKFSPLNGLPSQTLTVNQIRTGGETGTISVIKSLAATRKLTGE